MISSSAITMAQGMKVEKIGKCVVIRMERGENRLNMEFIDSFNRALDEAERYKRSLHCVYVANPFLWG